MTSVSMVDWKMEPWSSRRPDLAGVGQGAVVADGQHLAAVLHHERLGVDQKGGAGGGIAHVADAQMPGEALQQLPLEDLGDQPQTPVGAHPAAVAGDDAAGLLAPVLQGVKAEIGEPGRFGMAVDAEDAAVLPGFGVELFNYWLGVVRCGGAGEIHGSSARQGKGLREEC
jgi:hypothetical protein